MWLTLLFRRTPTTGRHMDAILTWPTSIWLEIERERMLLQLMDGPLRVVSCDVFAAVSTVVVVALSSRAVRASWRLVWLTADLYEVVGRSFVPLNPRLVISLSLFAVPGWCQTVRDRFVLFSTFTWRGNWNTDSTNTGFSVAFQTAACPNKSNETDRLRELDSFIHDMISDYDLQHL